MRISDWSSDVCSSDLTIVDRRIGIGIEERRLQDCGWKHDLDHAEIGIGIDLHRRHAPFPSVDGLTQLTNFIVVLKLARTQRIAEQIVAPDLQPRIIAPFIRITDLWREGGELFMRLGLGLSAHPADGKSTAV